MEATRAQLQLASEGLKVQKPWMSLSMVFSIREGSENGSFAVIKASPVLAILFFNPFQITPVMKFFFFTTAAHWDNVFIEPSSHDQDLFLGLSLRVQTPSLCMQIWDFFTPAYLILGLSIVTFAFWLPIHPIWRDPFEAQHKLFWYMEFLQTPGLLRDDW